MAESSKAPNTAVTGITGSGDDAGAQAPTEVTEAGTGSNVMAIMVAIGLVLAAVAGLGYLSARKLRRRPDRQ